MTFPEGPQHGDRRLTVDRSMLEDAVATLRAERQALWSRTEDRLRRLEASDWTLQTLKEHVEAEFTSRTEAQKIAMEAASAAVGKAERLADVRADAQDKAAKEMAARQNEWRGALNDVIAERLSRREYESAHAALVEKIDTLKELYDRDTAKMREAAGGQRLQTIIFAAMLTGIFSILVYLLLIHIR